MGTVDHAKFLIGLVIVALVVSGCERRAVGVYWVEKEGAGGGIPPEVQLPDQVPENWQPVEISGGPRVASYLVEAADADAEAADMAVTVFPGDVGGLLANVNRWRGEMSMSNVAADDLENVTERIVQVGHTIHLVDVASNDRQTLGAILPVAGETWFFKLTGPKHTVSANQEAFLRYIRALRVASPPLEEPADPDGQVESEQPTLTYRKPDSWSEEEATKPRVASFRVSGNSNREAEVAVIALGVSAGATLGTVNMWRSTLGLDATTEGKLPEMIGVVEAGGREFKIVEFESEEPVAAAGGKARLIVAYAPVGEHTWYFKVTGETSLVAEQKPILLEFLKSAEFGTPK